MKPERHCYELESKEMIRGERAFYFKLLLLYEIDLT